MNMRPGVMRREQVRFLAEHGIATIGGTRQGLGRDRSARALGGGAAAAAPH